MDVNMVNPFVNATLNVLGTMAFVKCKAEKPYLKQDNVAQGDISGVLGLTGDANGTVSVTFDEPCILKMVSSMLGEEMKELNSDISDAVSEMTNMISSQARLEIEKIGIKLQGAAPEVITEKNHELISKVKGPRVAFPFKTDAGSFTIEVCLESKTG